MSKNVPKVKETKDPYKATLCTYTYCQHSLPFKTFSCLKKHLIRKSYQIRFLLLIFDGFSRSCFECQVFECCPFFLSFHQSKPSRISQVAFIGFIDLVNVWFMSFGQGFKCQISVIDIFFNCGQVLQCGIHSRFYKGPLTQK